jgi:hypothetical protein
MHVVETPVQPPDQPMNNEPLLAVAVRVTAVPAATLALQAEPQAMPAGLLLTGPLPVPALLSSSGCIRMKVAVTLCASVMLTGQVKLVPLQAPDQPPNIEPGKGVAVRVTFVPRSSAALHVLPQLMPAGVLATSPAPLPAGRTVRVRMERNVAVTALSAFIATMQVVELLEHAPDQPPNVEPLLGVAVRVTLAPLRKLPLQVLPQLMPPGLLATFPAPPPALATCSARTAWNVAVTVFDPFMPITQVVPDPLQSPDQPPNADPLLGAAVSVTAVP